MGKPRPQITPGHNIRPLETDGYLALSVGKIAEAGKSR